MYNSAIALQLCATAQLSVIYLPLGGQAVNLDVLRCRVDCLCFCGVGAGNLGALHYRVDCLSLCCAGAVNLGALHC